MKTLLILLALILPTTAQAQSAYISPIDTDQSVGCTETGVYGSGTYTLDGNIFSWNVTFGNNPPDFDNGLLSTPETAAHIHRPAGVGGSILIDIGTGSPKIGSADISSIAIADPNDLNAELWYVNIHSDNCPSGEARGQILRAPPIPFLPYWALALLGGIAVLAVARQTSKS